MQLKTGDRVRILNELTYDSKDCIANVKSSIRTGGIAVDDVWIDEDLLFHNQNLLDEFWKALKEEGFVDEADENFIIPAGTEIVIVEFDDDSGSIISLNDRIKCFLQTMYFVFESDKEDEDDISVEIVI